MRQPFLADIHQTFARMTKVMSCQKFLKSYLVAINDKPVFFLANISQKVTHLQNYDKPLSTLTLTLAPECQEPLVQPQVPYHLRTSQLSIEPAELILACLCTTGMTLAEQHLCCFTSRSLQQLDNWDEWDATFDAQLDDHAQAGIFGKPVLHSSLPE